MLCDAHITKNVRWVPISSTVKISNSWIRDLRFNFRIHKKLIMSWFTNLKLSPKKKKKKKKLKMWENWRLYLLFVQLKEIDINLLLLLF